MGWFNSLMDIVKVDKDSNPKIETYENINNKEENVQDESIIDKAIKEEYENQLQSVAAGFSQFSIGKDLYGSIVSNKTRRLRLYRQMSYFTEVGDAIDEISDQVPNFDENSNYYSLNIKNEKISETRKQIIKKSIENFISYFNFDTNLSEYFEKFVIEGELAWENIINEKEKSVGFIGINFIEPDCYEYCFNMKTREKEGLTVFINKTEECNNTNLKKTFGHSNVQFTNLSNNKLLQEEKAIFMPWESLTYIDTGKYSFSKAIVLPILEKARKAYNQLALIEEAIIIHRLVRAPARLVFNVDVGKMPKRKAEEQLLKVMNKYQTKPVYNRETGTVANGYNTHAMLDSYWFARDADGKGTDVTTLDAGTGGLGDLEDLNYFVRKLYLSLKIPFTRYSEPTVNIENIDSINYEEYRFSKFIIKLLNRFEKGLKNSFVNHLKLQNLWETSDYKLNEKDICFNFLPPAIYDLYVSQRNFEIKLENYNKFIQITENFNEEGLRRYMGFDQKEIDVIWQSIEEAEVKRAKLDHKKANIEETGNENNPMSNEEDIWNNKE